MANQEEIIKIRRWEQLILNDNRLTVLMLLRERTIASQSQIQDIMRKKGSTISWSAIHRHFGLLTDAGLITRLEYAPLEPNDWKGQPRKNSGLNVGYKLTAEGRDFLATLIKPQSDRNG